MQASALTTWLVRPTQQRQHLGLCHLGPLWHLLGIEQCPIWCPVWVSLWLTVVVDVVDSREREIHEVPITKLRYNIQSLRKGCGWFREMDYHIRQSQISVTSHLTGINVCIPRRSTMRDRLICQSQQWQVSSLVRWTSSSAGRPDTQLGQQFHHHPSQ